MGIQDKCGKCKQEVLESQKALHCDCCSEWEHILCASPAVTVTQYKVLIKMDSALWMCSKCVGTWRVNLEKREASKWDKIVGNLKTEIENLSGKLSQVLNGRKDGISQNSPTKGRPDKIEKQSTQKRVSEGKNIKVGLNQIIVLGDSLVRGVGGVAGGKLDVRVHPGIGVSRMKDVLSNVTASKSKGIILHVGTNDVTGRERWGKTRLVREMEDLVASAVNKFGARKVAVSGLLYRGDLGRRAIDDMNLFLLRLCERQGVLFVEGNSWLTGEACYRDHVHLSEDGVGVFGELLGRVGARLLDRN